MDDGRGDGEGGANGGLRPSGRSVLELVSGGAIVAFAALLAGTSGFGGALVSTPFLLLLGFPLEFVVTANLALALLTRLSAAYQLRKHIVLRRASMMVVGSVPGFYLGIWVLTRVQESTIKLAAGVTAMIAALLLARAVNSVPPAPVAGAPLIAGLAGGFLGSTTSLSGIPPALLLTHDRVDQSSFLADLALYFVASSGIALFLFALEGTLDFRALFPVSLLWLPGSLLGNFLGAVLAPRIPERPFRYMALCLVFAAGGMSVVTSGGA